MAAKSARKSTVKRKETPEQKAAKTAVSTTKAAAAKAAEATAAAAAKAPDRCGGSSGRAECSRSKTCPLYAAFDFVDPQWASRPSLMLRSASRHRRS
jgi:outer membrane biosynthesis protein TonB